ncbi:MAG: Cof-type HAD-IIB family hydrolase [Peptostreptococcaceae bacterium]
MSQIIFFDIDGTLRDEAYGIPKTAKVAIDSCKKNGSYICLCTGRSVGTIPEDVFDLNVDGVIAGGGSYIAFQDKVLKNDFFSSNKIEEVKQYLEDELEEVAFTFETKENVFMNKEGLKILNHLNEEKFKYLSDEEKNVVENNQKIIYEDNINKFDSSIHQVNKICLWSRDNVFKNIESIISSENMQICQSFNFDNRNYYEIIQNGCNKGEAILELCDNLSIPINKTIAFGDGINDIDMLKTVGLAIGVENGNEEIFKYVDSICEEPMKDGIYLELKRRNII